MKIKRLDSKRNFINIIDNSGNWIEEYRFYVTGFNGTIEVIEKQMR